MSGAPTLPSVVNIVLDIWGGETHCDHVARFFCSIPEAFRQAETELRAGFLVNMRAEAAWGPDNCFDERVETVMQ